ncbi:MAG: response regulator transcription factor [Gammaproteobacteria bacterium]
MKLLIVEDSERLRNSLSVGLRRSGFAVDLAADGEAGLRFAVGADYDALILDLLLPRMDGLTLLRKLRGQGKNTNVLILSAKDQVQDRIDGLQLGADDYLIKPFSFDELRARLDALIRRRYQHRNPIIQLGCIELDTTLRQACSPDGELPLTRHEFALLEYLARNRGRVLTMRNLEDHLYDSETLVSSNAIEVHISSLRRKLRSAGEDDLIKTRRGFGYYIDAG